MINYAMIAVLISINALFFLTGIIWCKLTIDTSGRVNFTNRSKKNDQFQKYEPISIDNTKVVVDIKTEGLEKKYDSLGDVKNTQENISGSINKLKNMKG